jgi:hypothetical protein
MHVPNPLTHGFGTIVHLSCHIAFVIKCGNIIEREHLGHITGLVLILIKLVCFCGKCCVYIDKCMFIVIKIKCVNSNKISDICDKVNFTINYTHFITPNIYFIKILTTFYQNRHKYYNF